MSYGLASVKPQWDNPPAVTRGKDFKRRRLLLGVAQGVVAQYANVNIETIGRIESDKIVRTDSLEKAEAALAAIQADLVRHGGNLKGSGASNRRASHATSARQETLAAILAELRELSSRVADAIEKENREKDSSPEQTSTSRDDRDRGSGR